MKVVLVHVIINLFDIYYKSSLAFAFNISIIVLIHIDHKLYFLLFIHKFYHNH